MAEPSARLYWPPANRAGTFVRVGQPAIDAVLADGAFEQLPIVGVGETGGHGGEALFEIKAAVTSGTEAALRFGEAAPDLQVVINHSPEAAFAVFAPVGAVVAGYLQEGHGTPCVGAGVCCARTVFFAAR
jgi:hypothetical protein